MKELLKLASICDKSGYVAPSQRVLQGNLKRRSITQVHENNEKWNELIKIHQLQQRQWLIQNKQPLYNHMIHTKQPYQPYVLNYFKNNLCLVPNINYNNVMGRNISNNMYNSNNIAISHNTIITNQVIVPSFVKNQNPLSTIISNHIPVVQQGAQLQNIINQDIKPELVELIYTRVKSKKKIGRKILNGAIRESFLAQEFSHVIYLDIQKRSGPQVQKVQINSVNNQEVNINGYVCSKFVFICKDQETKENAPFFQQIEKLEKQISFNANQIIFSFKQPNMSKSRQFNGKCTLFTPDNNDLISLEGTDRFSLFRRRSIEHIRNELWKRSKQQTKINNTK